MKDIINQINHIRNNTSNYFSHSVNDTDKIIKTVILVALAILLVVPTLGIGSYIAGNHIMSLWEESQQKQIVNSMKQTGNSILFSIKNFLQTPVSDLV